jgi:two-component sensor histidine kinase
MEARKDAMREAEARVAALATYGALSTPTGAIDLAWEMATGVLGSELVLLWQEKGGPVVSPPTRRGFGTRLIETAFAAEVGGKASIDFKPGGLEYRIVAPASGLGSAA